MDTRQETDSLGEVSVPVGVYYGAQTARSLMNFPIGTETMPHEVIVAYALIKKAAALTNCELGVLSKAKADAIVLVCDEILGGDLKEQFPLKVWQTGSGTQTNMNVNEVISNRAIEHLGGKIGSKEPIHPNDDVNKSQSSNDTFPTAMHLATLHLLHQRLFPALTHLKELLANKSQAYGQLIKVGRTHLMDAAPLTLGHEFSGYVSQIEHALASIEQTVPELCHLAIGGTAVGTGLNAPKGYRAKVVNHLSTLSGLPLKPAPNSFEALASHDPFVTLSGALKRLACALMKIANDIRLMGSGPRCGLAELKLPANEPGSSIMPGKVNPTQCEALTQVATQVMGNDATVAIAASQGHFELNVYKPVIVFNVLQSIRLLADGSLSFADRCVAGLEPNSEKISADLDRSLMLATALNTKLGYDKASQIVKKAYTENLTLSESAIALGMLSEKECQELLDPSQML